MTGGGTRLAPDAGVIAPATAVVMAVLLGMLGLVTDTSVWYAQKRQLQGVTDAAALAAAAAISTNTARASAEAILTQNGVDPATAIVKFESGYYCPDIASAVPARFRAVACADGVGGATANAVRIATKVESPLMLSKLFSTASSQRIDVISTASRVNQAGIEAGSGLAALNNGIANAVLSALTGGSVSLTAAQYDGLLKTNVDTLTFLDALATKLNVSAGSYGQMLQTSAGVGDVIDAQISALSRQSQVADAAAAIAGLQALKAQVAGNPSVSLAKLFDLGMWSDTPVGGSASPSALHAGINLMQLTSFSLQLANQNHFATVPSSSIGIPGLASIQVTATAIEPPAKSYFAFGPVGTSVHTAQVRLKLDLNVLNLAQQLGAGATVPLYIEVAAGDATISSISCTGAPATDAVVGVTARGGVSNVYIGAPSNDAMKNFSAPVAASAVTPVRIFNLGVPGLVTLADTTAKAAVTIGSTNGAGTALTFVQPSGTVVQPEPPTQRGVIGRPATDTQTASTGTRARAVSTNVTSNLLGGLAETLSARVCTANLLGACILPTTVTGAALGPLYTVLDPVLTGLDSILDTLLRSLGVQLGYVDVTVTGVRCGLPVLVS